MKPDRSSPVEDRGLLEQSPTDSQSSAGIVARRLAKVLAMWGSPGVLVCLVAGDWRAATTLTLCMALSIVHVRSLQAQVSRLDPDSPLRAGVISVVRWGFLMLGLLGVLSVGVDRPLALAWGISLLPLALITEAVLSALASRS